MKRWSVGLLVTSWILFISSLFLTAVRTEVPGVEIWGTRRDIPVSFLGWQAAWAGFRLLPDLADNPSLVLWVLAALGNLVFILSPLCLVRRWQRLSQILPTLLLAATLWEASMFVQLGGWRTFTVGYYAWVLAFALGTVGTYLNQRAGVRRVPAGVQ